MKTNNNTPEITLKAILLGIVLSMVLAGANAYLGLFAGMTVSASIPIALKKTQKKNIIKKNNLILFCGFGVGLSWSTAIYKY